MADRIASSTVAEHGASGNAGTLGDPMGFDEAILGASAGDRVILLADGTYSLTQTTGITTSGTSGSPIQVLGASSGGLVGGGTPVINMGSNSINALDFNGNRYWHVKDLEMTSPGHSFSSSARFLAANRCLFVNITAELGNNSEEMFNACVECTVFNCSADDVGSTPGAILFRAATNEPGNVLYGCSATGGASLYSGGIRSFGTALIACVCDGAANSAITLGSNNFNLGVLGVDRCIVANGSGVGIEAIGGGSDPQALSVANTILYNNASDGIKLAGNGRFDARGCVFLGNGGYGVNMTTADWLASVIECYTAANTSGSHTGNLMLADFTSLGMDPFTDAPGGDFSLDTSNVSGQALRDANLGIGNGTQDAYPFRTLLDPLPTGGGGGSVGFA